MHPYPSKPYQTTSEPANTPRFLFHQRKPIPNNDYGQDRLQNDQKIQGQRKDQSNEMTEANQETTQQQRFQHNQEPYR